MVGNPIGQGHDRQGWIEPAIGDMQTGVGDKQVFYLMNLAITVRDGGFGVVAHAAGAGLVLPPA